MTQKSVWQETLFIPAFYWSGAVVIPSILPML